MNKFSHYFVDDSTKEHKNFQFTFDYKNKHYIINSQDGVFSKKEVDAGSLFLVDCVIKENISGDGLDLGCGYGIITLLLASNLDVKMWACDINERAVNLTKLNLKCNKIDANVSVSNVADNIDKDNFDFVISNPPIRAGNTILFKFFQDSYKKLRLGGVFYAVLRKKQGADTYMKKISEIFGNCDIVDKHKGFVVVKSIK